MSAAVLYGVGVGPGAPDLLTLRAAALLRDVPVVAAPRRADGDGSLALRIARQAVGEVPGQETLLLTFPMSRDPEARRAAREAAAREVGARLAAGRSVAFVTEGDPLVYSTFLDLLAEARRGFPEARVEVVPGVSSLTAVAAAAVVPLADGDGRLAVVPAPSALGELGKLAREFETVLLLKAGGVLPELREALAREGLLGRAVLVSGATTGGEQVTRDLGAVAGRPGYFTTVLVTRAVEGER